MLDLGVYRIGTVGDKARFVGTCPHCDDLGFSEFSPLAWRLLNTHDCAYTRWLTTHPCTCRDGHICVLHVAPLAGYTLFEEEQDEAVATRAWEDMRVEERHDRMDSYAADKAVSER